jgi:nucleolar protein 56
MADAATLFCLLESAAGYSLFEVVAMDEIAALLEDSAATITDLKRFGRAVKLKSFLGFESAASALENANAVSEHAMTDTLRNFLEANLPASSRKKTKTPPFALGVIDPALATAISSGLGGISCRSDETVREVLRGCRLHLPTLVKGLASGNDKKAQLGLGHSYSRSKVKFNPARSDNMIIQSIALLDQLDKDVNTFAMRVREWYSWHFPELKDIVKDNIMYARTAAFVQDKSSLLSSAEGTSGSSTDKFEGLVNVLGGDDDMARAVVLAAKTSMGMDCSSTDMINIVNFTSRMVRLAEYRKQLGTYLSDKMNVVAPNLSALIGDSVAARLISKVRQYYKRMTRDRNGACRAMSANDCRDKTRCNAPSRNEPCSFPFLVSSCAFTISSHTLVLVSNMRNIHLSLSLSLSVCLSVCFLANPNNKLTQRASHAIVHNCRPGR